MAPKQQYPETDGVMARIGMLAAAVDLAALKPRTALENFRMIGNALPQPAPAETGPAIGTAMPDGSLYAGISPDTGKPFFAAAADAPMLYTAPAALKCALRLEAHGRRDWRMPTRGELELLYTHRAALGVFDSSGSFPSGWYWSSTPRRDYESWARSFRDGKQDFLLRFLHLRLRCVR